MDESVTGSVNLFYGGIAGVVRTWMNFHDRIYF